MHGILTCTGGLRLSDCRDRHPLGNLPAEMDCSQCVFMGSRAAVTGLLVGADVKRDGIEFLARAVGRASWGSSSGRGTASCAMCNQWPDGLRAAATVSYRTRGPC